MLTKYRTQFYSAMTLAQFSISFDRMVHRLERDMPDLITGFAHDVIANVQERVQMQGKNSQGGRLKAYTKAYEKFKKNPQNYKRGQELGLASSRFTGVVDYTLTGRMWADIRVLKVESNGSSVRAKVGAFNQENVNKLISLQKRDGLNPIAPSAEEVEIAKENLKENILNYFQFI